MMSLVSTFWRRALCVSTTGVSPVTVIVSVTVPTRSWKLIGMTPVPVYEPEGRLVDLRETRILAKAADRWKLRPIDLDEFNAIRAEVEAGTYRYRIVEQEFKPAVYFEDPERYLNRLQQEAR
jgi:urea carboxylase